MVANQTNAEFCAWAGEFRLHGLMGHLYSPGATRGPYKFFPYALDNGAYPAWEKNLDWDEAAWLKHLDWAAAQKQQPLWVVVPDVVTDRDRTLERWEKYYPVVNERGFRA